MNESMNDATVYFGHSKDFSHELNSAARLTDIENKLGIRPMLKKLAEAGWDWYQWRNSRDGRTSFIELSGLVHGDFLRANSETEVLHAVEALTNRTQAILKCERTTGHDFTTRPGYKNGLLGCRHCGFGGYPPLFAQKSRELGGWKDVAQGANERLRTVSAQLGVYFNIAGEILLDNKFVREADPALRHTVVQDTDEVFFEVKREKEMTT